MEYQMKKNYFDKKTQRKRSQEKKGGLCFEGKWIIIVNSL